MNIEEVGKELQIGIMGGDEVDQGRPSVEMGATGVAARGIES